MKNNFKTFILLAAMTSLLLLGGQAIGGRGGMMIALLMAAAMNIAGYWFSDKIALSMAGAQEVSVNDAPELHAIVERLATRAGIPKPRVYVTPDSAPNAFATGRNPAHSAVAVTAGILDLLDRRELEGVLAHELGHVKNRDILISSVAAMMAGTISHLAHMAQWAMIFGNGRDDREGEGGGIGGLLMIILAPIAAMLIQMAVSRSREYEADATGARICGDPLALASALRKMDGYLHQRPMHVSPATAHMYIANPLGNGGLMSLFMTHPPMAERIRRLSDMAVGRS